MYMRALGVPIPKGSFRGVSNLESLVKREDILEVLEESLSHANSGLKELEAAGRLEDQTHLLHDMTTHLHHHMGQATVYARLAGVVPSWTLREPEMLRERDRRE